MFYEAMPLGRALVFSDLQADLGLERLRSDPTMPLQIWRTLRFYADLAALYRMYGCRHLIDLGDTTEVRSTVPWTVITAVGRALWSINPEPLVSIKLVGNHEQLYRNTQVSSGDFYMRHHMVVESRLVIDLGEGRPAVVAVSYPADHLELESWLARTAAMLRGRRTLLLGHFQVRGSYMPSGTAAEGVAPSVLESYTLGLLGHVHRPQTVPGTAVHYVGSPFQQDRGEAGESKRVGLLDLDTLDLEWLQLPSRYPAYSEVGVDQFQTMASDIWEDRPIVTVCNAAEARKFYALPNAQAVSVSLQHFKTDKAPGDTQGTALDRKALLQAYATENKLEGVPADELVQAAEAFCV